MTFFVSMYTDSGPDVVGGRAFVDSLQRLLPLPERTVEADSAVMVLHNHHPPFTLTTAATTTFPFRQRQTKRILADAQAVVYIFDETLLSTSTMVYHLQFISDYLPHEPLPWIWVVDNYDMVSLTTPEMLHLPAHLSMPPMTSIHQCCFRYDYGTLRLWHTICVLAGGKHV